MQTTFKVFRLLCPIVCFVSWSVVAAANPITSSIRNKGNGSSSDTSVVEPEPVSVVDDPFGVDVVERLTADEDGFDPFEVDDIDETLTTDEYDDLGPFEPGPVRDRRRESSVAGNSEYAGIVCRDRRGNVVSQAKRDTVIDDNGRVSRITESETIQHFGNGRSKSFVSEYSSTNVVGGSSLAPLSNGRRFVEIPSDLKPFVDRSIGHDEPAETVQFEDRHGNAVTQVKRKKEETLVNGGDGGNQRVRALESSEIKSLPNGFAKSFREHYSSDSVVGSDEPISCRDQYGNVLTLVKNKNDGNRLFEDVATNNIKKK